MTVDTAKRSFGISLVFKTRLGEICRPCVILSILDAFVNQIAIVVHVAEQIARSCGHCSGVLATVAAKITCKV